MPWLTQKENLHHSLQKYISNFYGQVNNAGGIVFGTCEETTVEDFDKMMEINIRFVLKISNEILLRVLIDWRVESKYFQK